jgi:hypothetical protein
MSETKDDSFENRFHSPRVDAKATAVIKNFNPI